MPLGPLLGMSFVWRNQALWRRDDASVPRTRASKRGRSTVEYVEYPKCSPSLPFKGLKMFGWFTDLEISFDEQYEERGYIIIRTNNPIMLWAL